MIAYLPIGPQGSGKTTWCKAALLGRKSVTYLSRDELIMERLGRTTVDPYTHQGSAVQEELWRRIDWIAGGSRDLLLDCWNGSADERRFIIQQLKDRGYNHVIGLHFVTDRETCLHWYEERERRLRGEDTYLGLLVVSCGYNYDRYQNHPVHVDQGFCAIYPIDPRIPLVPFLPDDECQ